MSEKDYFINTPEYKSETVAPIFDSGTTSIERHSKAITPSPSGYSGGNLTTAQEQMIGGGIQAGASALATGIGAGFEAGATRRAQDEARTMNEQERATNLQQQSASNSLKRRSISNEERAMKLSQKQQEFDLRINRFINKIQSAVENQQYVLENKDQMFNALNDENVRSAILKSFV